MVAVAAPPACLPLRCLDVRSNRRLVAPDRRDEVPPCPEVLPNSRRTPPVQHLAPAFRDEHDMVLAFPLRVAETLVVVHRNSSSCGFGGSRGGVPLFAPGTVKLWMPPRQSRGVSQRTLVHHDRFEPRRACTLSKT